MSKETKSIFDNVHFLDESSSIHENVLLENVNIGAYKFHLLMSPTEHNPRFKMIMPVRYNNGCIGIKYCHKIVENKKEYWSILYPIYGEAKVSDSKSKIITQDRELMDILKIISVKCRSDIITAYSGQFKGSYDLLASRIENKYNLMTNAEKRQCLLTVCEANDKQELPKIMKEYGLDGSTTIFKN